MKCGQLKKLCLRTINITKEAVAPEYSNFQKFRKVKTSCSKKCIPGLLFHLPACKLGSLGTVSVKYGST
jgi:hypothetical protein